MKQLSLIPKPNPICDGTHNGKRKEARTIATKNAMHVVLKIEHIPACEVSGNIRLSNGSELDRSIIHFHERSQEKVSFIGSGETTSLFDHREEVRRLLHRHAEKFSVRIYTWSIQKDHIHILALFPSRACYIKFVRSQTGLLARVVRWGGISGTWTIISSKMRWKCSGYGNIGSDWGGLNQKKKGSFNTPPYESNPSQELELNFYKPRTN